MWQWLICLGMSDSGGPMVSLSLCLLPPSIPFSFPCLPKFCPINRPKAVSLFTHENHSIQRWIPYHSVTIWGLVSQETNEKPMPTLAYVWCSAFVRTYWSLNLEHSIISGNPRSALFNCSAVGWTCTCAVWIKTWIPGIFSAVVAFSISFVFPSQVVNCSTSLCLQTFHPHFIFIFYTFINN